jgi:hypothetical protein
VPITASSVLVFEIRGYPLGIDLAVSEA